MNYKLQKIRKYTDHRGHLIVFLRESDLIDAKKKLGQIYFVTFNKKGVVRGNHYHKKWHEWFGIISGKVSVKLVDVNTKEEVNFILDANKDKYRRLEIGPYTVHAIRSLSANAVLLNYADSEWSKDDSIYYKII